MNIVVVGSTGRCGIHEYSRTLVEGFQALGHQARYIGVRRHDNSDLMERIREVEEDDDLVIFEYEPGIFWLGGLVRAMGWLRLVRGKRIVLSVHEIAPEKYPEFGRIQHHLARPVSGRRVGEIVRLLASTGDVALRFLMMRGALLAMGWLPHTVLVHSPKGEEDVRIALGDDDRIRSVPLTVQQLEGDRDALREQLELPQNVFAFIVPGFLFRRKRITDVIRELPSGAELWIVGTESAYDPGYLEEIEAFLAQSEKRASVRLIQDYKRMEKYLLAADAAVLFYTDAYQSGIASLAVGAGKPCIFSDLPAFVDLREAGLTARTPAELHKAMKEIQEPSRYQELVTSTKTLGENLSPEKTALQYLNCQT